MIRHRLMTWCTAAAVLAPTAAYAQHGKATPHSDVEVTVSPTHDEHGAGAKDEKATTETSKTTSRTAASSKRTSASRERSSRQSRSRSAKASAEHEEDAAEVAKAEPAAKHGKDEGDAHANTGKDDEKQGKAGKEEKSAKDVRSERASRTARAAQAGSHEPEKSEHGAEKADEHETAPKSSKGPRAARAARPAKSETADSHAAHDEHDNEQIAKVVSKGSGPSTHVLEQTMERINTQVDEIKGSAPPAKPASAGARKPAAPARRVVTVAAPAAESAPSRVQLTWRTVLDWPADLQSDSETSERADLPHIALSWPAKN